MSRVNEIVVVAELAFFEKWSASISHDIKNSLAVINESAGLLEDLALGAEKGIPLDPGKLKDLSARVKKQVRRANDIVDNMRRFAGSIERPAQKVDLIESLGLMCALGARSAALLGKRLAPDLSAESVEIFTVPTLLNQAIWMCIEDALQAAGESRILAPALQPGRDSAKIIFKPLKNLPDAAGVMLHRKEAGRVLLEALGAAVTVDIAGEALVLALADFAESR